MTNTKTDNEEIFKLLKARQNTYREWLEVVDFIIQRTNLSKRTAEALKEICERSDDISLDDINSLLNQDFLTNEKIKIAIKNNLKDLVPYYYFLDQDFVKEVNITELPNNFVRNDLGIDIITIPEGIEIIREYAFRNCINLKKVVFPKSLRLIEKGAFENCVSLKNITIPSNVEDIEEYVFANCKGLEEITFKNPLRLIKEGTFLNCYKLKAFNSKKREVKVKQKAFYNCKSLKTLPITLRKAEEESFKNCSLLKNITLNATRIESEAFSGCDNLEHVELKTIPYYISKSAFGGCNKLKELNSDAYKYKIDLIKTDGEKEFTSIEITPSRTVKEALNEFNS